MLGRPAGRPYKFVQTSDVAKTSDVFRQGRGLIVHRRISQNEGFPRHRMSGRHPMSNRDEFRWRNEIGFAIIKSRWGE